MRIENCTIGQLFNYLNNNLKLSKSDSIKLLSYITNIDANKILFNFQNELFLDININNLLAKIKQGYPLAYLIKSKEFYGLDFYVDERVLIPRIETEILVDYVIKNSNIIKPSVLDICTGSGTIILSLLNSMDISFSVAFDKSFDALQVASKNADRFHLSERVNFICADVFDLPNYFKNKFDIILCNPPYVSNSDKYEASIEFEPKIAIFAKEDGLIFYKKILSIIDKLCNKDGFACFEIGADQKDDLESIGKQLGKKLYFKKDYSKNYRIMIWKNS